MIAAAADPMQPLEPGDRIAVDDPEPIAIPEGFVHHTDEFGRKMYRIPWGAELSALKRALKTAMRREGDLRTGLDMPYYVTKKLAKKKARKAADMSRRRNRK